MADLPRTEELVTGDAPPLPGLNAPISTADEAEEAPAPEAESPPEAAEEASQR
jgi:hypothetical protein